MKISKLLVAVFVTALMAMTLIGATGCANNANENVIRTSLAEELDAYKNHDASVVSQIRMQNAAELAMLGIDGEEYANALLDGFDYSIENVKVDGDKATVTLVLTQKYLDEAEAEAVMDELANDPAFQRMSYSERQTAISDKMFEYIASVEAAPQDPVTLNLVLKDKVWDLAPESAATVQNLFTF